MNKNKKLLAVGAASLAAVGAIVAGSFAFFVDSAEKETTGTAGDVTISMTDLGLSNAENINPGDNDETKSASARPGTPHNLTFSVSNDGTKSIMTRNIITIEVEDGTLPAAVYSLKTSDTAELGEKFYSVDGNTFVAADTVTDLSTVKAVRYITPQVELNAASGIESNDAVATTVAGVSTNDAVTEASFDYLLKLDKKAADEYEKSKLAIEVEVQAMQWRNTEDADWTTLFTDMLTVN